MKRIAHFLHNPGLDGSPPNDALMRIYTDLGYGVDLYSTWDTGSAGCRDQQASVRRLPIEYGLRALARTCWRPRWSRYAAFSCTTEDPAAIAGTLARIWRRPLIVSADEILSGSYAGNRSARWKSLCRFGMRAASLTIVNTPERVDLQRAYAGLASDAAIIVYPGAFVAPPAPAERAAVAQTRAFPSDRTLLCFSGTFSIHNGGIWFLDALRSHDLLHGWGQCVLPDRLASELLRRLGGTLPLTLEAERLSWSDAWRLSGAADIGVVIYLHDGPQWRNMGIASNRLCMFLSMGVPVIASRQPSFQFIEDFDCGVLVDSADEFRDAIARMIPRLPELKQNALRAAREYIRAAERYDALKGALAQVLA